MRPLILEDFASVPVVEAPVEVYDGERLEAERLEAFDKGYASGWEDATAAAESAAEDRAQALDSRLEELAFTFHEARAHVMRGLHPLLDAIVRSAVPRILHDTLAVRLTELFTDLAEDAADAEIHILTALNEAEGVAEMLEDRVRFPVTIREDATLAPGTFHVRLGECARELDLGAIETALAAALEALDTINEETLSHG
ncbi:hypothetical protein [Palleronia sp.]|uniref:hypothetical protein n=1 Tax=Palleronia sp. TaxID=1940284 RepID=UPI0035C7EB41